MDIEGILAISLIFLGLPWLVFHYITQWKKTGSLTREDENLMDELYDRLNSIERIISADNPNWRN
jgi:phage shock protein B